MDSGKAMSVGSERFERPVFAAVIRPHRSLGRRAFRIVMALCCVATAVASLPFLVLGFWPVAGFFGLDLLALFIAFQVNFRSAEGFEEVELTPLELLVRRVTHRGEAREWRFNPLWTRLDREVDDEFGLLKLALVSRGESLVIARDLSPPERESLAEALGRALSDVKRGY
jgi:uncharacterized membrane protein